jgi:hypothetical protein
VAGEEEEEEEGNMSHRQLDPEEVALQHVIVQYITHDLLDESPDPPPVTTFTSLNEPAIPIAMYIDRLWALDVSQSCHVSAAGILRDLFQTHPRSINRLSIHRAYLTALLVSTKAIDDRQPTNADFAKFGGVSVGELAMLEMHLAQHFGFDVTPFSDAKPYAAFARILQNTARCMGYDPSVVPFPDPCHLETTLPRPVFRVCPYSAPYPPRLPLPLPPPPIFATTVPVLPAKPPPPLPMVLRAVSLDPYAPFTSQPVMEHSGLVTAVYRGALVTALAPLPLPPPPLPPSAPPSLPTVTQPGPLQSYVQPTRQVERYSDLAQRVAEMHRAQLLQRQRAQGCKVHVNYPPENHQPPRFRAA